MLEVKLRFSGNSHLSSSSSGFFLALYLNNISGCGVLYSPVGGFLGSLDGSLELLFAG